MSKYDYDLFVIGVGSGGVRAARMSAQYGARVATAEDRYMGGTCVNVGCIPKKLFVLASHFSEDFRDATGYGWSEVHPAFDWETLLTNKNKEIARLNEVYRGLLESAGVRHFDGRARIVDQHQVSINGQNVSTDKILIATGSWPSIPDFPGKEHVISSNEAFYLDELPRHCVIAGGGYIAIEFAGIFEGLGVETHLAYRGPLFLRGFDDDLRKTLAEEMPKKNVHLHFNTTIERIEKLPDGQLKVQFNTGSVVTTDLVLCATGRVPNVADLGLENVNVECRDNGAIIVDDQFRTSEPSIFALGDVTDRIQLTPVAIAEAMVFAKTQFLDQSDTMNYENVASAVFSQPPMATVGLTEAEAREQFDAIEIYRTSFRALKHTLSGNEEKTMMKLIVDKATDRVVGVHMLGADAPEIVQGIAIALKAGATKAVFDATVGIHPTTAEEFVTMREPVAS